ncbi:MAG: metalloregulator ArsR/SmtB family transcription factor [Betaproteobacteria bacterium]|nr:metalloregulator ArsR/SmtB family transcription factor [Betaproteobacteria bacterium]
MIQAQALFDSLSDAIRRRLLALIQKEGELCVCELVAALGMPQPKISRHLAVMREAGLLAIRREGTWIYYRLDAHLPLWAYRIVEIASRDAPEAESDEDRMRLARMKAKPTTCLS